MSGQKLTIHLAQVNQTQTNELFEIEVQHIRNPPSTKKVSNFGYTAIQDYFGNATTIFNSSSLSVKTYQSAKILNANLTQSSTIPNSVSRFTITFTPASRIIAEGEIQLYLPMQLYIHNQTITFYSNETYNSSYYINYDGYQPVIKIRNAFKNLTTGQVAIQFNATLPGSLNPSYQQNFYIKTYDDTNSSDIADELRKNESLLFVKLGGCQYPCKTCEDESLWPTYCTSCFNDGKSYLYYNRTYSRQDCAYKCPDGYTSNGSFDKRCSSCDYICATCLDQGNVGDKFKCTSCQSGLLYVEEYNECLQTCPSGFIQVNETCEKCASTCQTCSGSIFNCTSCQDDGVYKYQWMDTCMQKCPYGYTTFENNKTCSKCVEGCLECDYYYCTQCNSTLYNYYGQCLEQCPYSYEASANRTCLYVNQTNNTNSTNGTNGGTNDTVTSPQEVTFSKLPCQSWHPYYDVCTCRYSANTSLFSNYYEAYKNYLQVTITGLEFKRNLLKEQYANFSSLFMNNITARSSYSSSSSYMENYLQITLSRQKFLVTYTSPYNQTLGAYVYQTHIIMQFEDQYLLYLFKNFNITITLQQQNFYYYDCNSTSNKNVLIGGSSLSNYNQSDTNCKPNCESCAPDGTCIICDSAYYKIFEPRLSTYNCTTVCGFNTYMNVSAKTCDYCINPNCSSCSSTNECFDCLSPINTYFNESLVLSTYSPIVQCLNSCPPGTFDDNDRCTECHQNCSACTSSTWCTDCKSGYQWNQGVCRSLYEGQQGYFLSSNGAIEPCDPQCLNCEYNATNCTLCANTSVVFNEMRQECMYPFYGCPMGTYLQATPTHERCTLCPEGCLGCSSPTNCSYCQYGYFLNINGSDSKCVQTCPKGTYGDLTTNLCTSCQPGCEVCNMTWAGVQCEKCANGTYNMLGTCLASCPQGTYNSSNSTMLSCSNCSYGCQDCTERKQCNICDSASGFKLVELTNQGEFYYNRYPCIWSTDTCPVGTYPGPNSCLKCAQGCANCIDQTNCTQYCSGNCTDCFGSPYSCTNCSAGMHLVEISNGTRTCIDQCGNNGYYLDSSTNKCLPCIYNCKACLDSKTCLQCKPGNYLQKYYNSYTDSYLDICASMCMDSNQIINQATQSCQNCPAGCEKCSQIGSCDQCKSYTIKNNVTGACECAPLQYQILPSMKYNTTLVDFYKIKFDKVFLNRTFACSELLYAVLKQNVTGVANELYDLSSFQCQLWDFSTYYYTPLSIFQNYKYRLVVENITYEFEQNFTNYTLKLFINQTWVEYDCAGFNNETLLVKPYDGDMCNGYKCIDWTINITKKEYGDLYSPEIKLQTWQTEYLKCQPIDITFSKFLGFFNGTKSVSWFVEVTSLSGLTYSNDMYKVNTEMRSYIQAAQDKTYLVFPSNWTEQITGDIILKVSVTAENTELLKHSTYQEYRLRGNYNFLELNPPYQEECYASDGYTFNPKFTKPFCPSSSGNIYTMTPSQMYQMNCSLYDEQNIFIGNLSGCRANSTNGLKNNKKYYLKYHMQPHIYHKQMEGQFLLKTALVYPQCTVNGAGNIYRNASQDIYLSASIIGNDIDFFYYKWTCYLSNGLDLCPNIQSYLTTMTNHTIYSGTLNHSSTYIFQMQVISSDNSLTQLTICNVTVSTFPANVTNCDYSLASISYRYENPRNYLYDYLNNNFECTLAALNTSTTTTALNQSYTWSLTDYYTGANLFSNLTSSQVKTSGKQLLVKYGVFEPNRMYSIGCNVTGTYCGTVTNQYTTYPSSTVNASFYVQPTSGYSNETFYFYLQKYSSALTKCDFGYLDPSTRVMVRLNNDYLTKNFSNTNEEYLAKLPGNSNQNIIVYAKCVDLNNLVGVYTAKVNVSWSQLTSTTYSQIQQISQMNETLTQEDTLMQSHVVMQYKDQLDNATLKDAYEQLSNSIATFNDSSMSIGEKATLSELMNSMTSDVKNYFGNDSQLLNSTKNALLNLLSGGKNLSVSAIEVETFEAALYTPIDDVIFTNLVNSTQSMMDIYNDSAIQRDLLVGLQYSSNQYLGQIEPNSNATYYQGSSVSLGIYKTTQESFASTGSLNMSLSGTDGYSSMSISIPYEDTLFGANATVSLKSFVADPTLATGSTTPQGYNDSSFASQMLIVTLEVSDYTVVMDEEYSMQTMRVEAMTQRITLEISLTDISPDNDEYEQRCAYYDTFLQEWVIDEGERANDGSMFCYPNHLTTFAVLRVPTEYSKITLVKSFILTSVVIFDAFIIIIALTGYIFQRQNFNKLSFKDFVSLKTVYAKEKDGSPKSPSKNPFNMSQVNNSALSEGEEEKKEGDIEEMKQVENKRNLDQSYSDAAMFRKQSKISNEVIEKKLVIEQKNFSDLFLMSLQIYHRIISCFFINEYQKISKPMKTVISIAQFYVLLVITGAFSSNMLLSDPVSAILTIVAIMRVVQVLFNFLTNYDSENHQKVQRLNVIVIVLAILLLATAHVALAALNNMELSEKQFNEWSALVVGCLFFELVIWDMCIVPFAISLTFKCSGRIGMVLFSAMTLAEGKQPYKQVDIVKQNAVSPRYEQNDISQEMPKSKSKVNWDDL